MKNEEKNLQKSETLDDSVLEGVTGGKDTANRMVKNAALEAAAGMKNAAMEGVARAQNTVNRMVKNAALDDDALDNVAGGISVSFQPTLEEMNWGKNNDQEDC